MDIGAEMVEPVTPAPSHNLSIWRNEDSGYHTSFTPSSVERSGVSTGILDLTNTTPESNFQIVRKFRLKNNLSTHYESPDSSPTKRRGIKRRFQDVCDENTAPTPTTVIAGGIKNLNVNDNNNAEFISPCSPCKSTRYSHAKTEYAINLTFPSTPIKKVCRSSCKHNPLRESINVDNFTIHSLQCSTNGLQPVQVQDSRIEHRQLKTIEPNTDLIQSLYNKNQEPPLQKIFSYLSNEDIYVFNLVSHKWNLIWSELSYKKQKKEHGNYLQNLKENQENKEKDLPKPKLSDNHQIRSLKEMHAILNVITTSSAATISPPSTPRATKFKKFTKLASQDGRLQVLCIRCSHPAKITKEVDEQWAECTNNTCAFQFCRFCYCSRHPGIQCTQYGLEKLSPIRRKKPTNGICSKQSRKGLKRLNF